MKLNFFKAFKTEKIKLNTKVNKKKKGKIEVIIIVSIILKFTFYKEFKNENIKLNKQVNKGKIESF